MIIILDDNCFGQYFLKDRASCIIETFYFSLHGWLRLSNSVRKKNNKKAVFKGKLFFSSRTQQTVSTHDYILYRKLDERRLYIILLLTNKTIHFENHNCIMHNNNIIYYTVSLYRYVNNVAIDKLLL